MPRQLPSIKYSEGLSRELRHGIQFGIWNPERKLSICEVEYSLASALAHYKELKERYAGFYQYAYFSMTRFGVDIPGELQLLPPKSLRATAWVAAIADAYSCVTTVQQILEAPQAWKDAAERDGGDFGEVIDTLEKPSGELLAIFMLIKRRLAVSMTSGSTGNWTAFYSLCESFLNL